MTERSKRDGSHQASVTLDIPTSISILTESIYILANGNALKRYRFGTCIRYILHEMFGHSLVMITYCPQTALGTLVLFYSFFFFFFL